MRSCIRCRKLCCINCTIYRGFHNGPLCFPCADADRNRLIRETYRSREADVDASYPEEPPPLVEATRVPAMPVPKAKCVPATPGVRYWLQDTGCPVDLAGKKSLPPKLVEHIHKSEDPQNFDTANGALPADEQVAMQIEGVPDNVHPYVLKDSPDVMTIGRRCVRVGYGFHWPAFSTRPYYDLPAKFGGGRLNLVSIGDVPYLLDTWNPEGLKNALPAMPATFARKVTSKRASSCLAREKPEVKEEAEGMPGCTYGAPVSREPCSREQSVPTLQRPSRRRRRSVRPRTTSPKGT